MTLPSPDLDRLEAVSIDLTIAEAQIRALMAIQVRRSPTAFGDLLQALSAEAEALATQAEGQSVGDCRRLEAASAGLHGVVESLKDLALCA